MAGVVFALVETGDLMWIEKAVHVTTLSHRSAEWRCFDQASRNLEQQILQVQRWNHIRSLPWKHRQLIDLACTKTCRKQWIVVGSHR